MLSMAFPPLVTISSISWPMLWFPFYPCYFITGSPDENSLRRLKQTLHLFSIEHRLLGDVTQALAAGLLFALHPVRFSVLSFVLKSFYYSTFISIFVQ